VKRSDPSRKAGNTKPKVACPSETETSDSQKSTRQAIAKRPGATANLVSQDHCHRTETPQVFSERKRLFLRVGDEVTHQRYEEWGMGVVMEVMTSSVPGGTCLARVRFQDGQLRCFNNDLDNESCCYYFGVRRYWNPSHGVNAIRSKFFLRG
jgi:hypothetical protein